MLWSPLVYRFVMLYRATHCCLETTVIDSSIPWSRMSHSLIGDKRRDKCVLLCFLQEEQLTLQREDNQQLISEVSCFIAAQLGGFLRLSETILKDCSLFRSWKTSSSRGTRTRRPWARSAKHIRSSRLQRFPYLASGIDLWLIFVWLFFPSRGTLKPLIWRCSRTICLSKR